MAQYQRNNERKRKAAEIMAWRGSEIGNGWRNRGAISVRENQHRVMAQLKMKESGA